MRDFFSNGSQRPQSLFVRVKSKLFGWESFIGLGESKMSNGGAIYVTDASKKQKKPIKSNTQPIQTFEPTQMIGMDWLSPISSAKLTHRSPVDSHSY